MGKTPKPLTIMAHYPIWTWDEIIALAEQGHRITHDPTEYEDYDLILGPSCWLMDDDHRKYLDLAIKSARSKRYPKES